MRSKFFVFLESDEIERIPSKKEQAEYIVKKLFGDDYSAFFQAKRGDTIYYQDFDAIPNGRIVLIFPADLSNTTGRFEIAWFISREDFLTKAKSYRNKLVYVSHSDGTRFSVCSPLDKS